MAKVWIKKFDNFSKMIVGKKCVEESQIRYNRDKTIMIFETEEEWNKETPKEKIEKAIADNLDTQRIMQRIELKQQHMAVELLLKDPQEKDQKKLLLIKKELEEEMNKLV